MIKASHHQPRATQLPSAQLSPALSTEQTSSAINIPGIGEIPSSWVGLTGKRCLGRLLEQEELQPVVKMLKRDIHKLATTCQKALKKLGAEKSCDREVSVALELCGHYASAKTERGCKATRIQELWVNQDEDNTASPMKNAQDRAKQAIGEKLVNVITQQGKQRPDVSTVISFNFIPCTVFLPVIPYVDSIWRIVVPEISSIVEPYFWLLCLDSYEISNNI